MSACPPLLDIERPNRRSCNQFNEKVLAYLADNADNADISTVILAARWNLSASGSRYKEEHGVL